MIKAVVIRLLGSAAELLLGIAILAWFCAGTMIVPAVLFLLPVCLTARNGCDGQTWLLTAAGLTIWVVPVMAAWIASTYGAVKTEQERRQRSWQAKESNAYESLDSRSQRSGCQF
jgi:hypothetical protein